MPLFFGMPALTLYSNKNNEKTQIASDYLEKGKNDRKKE